MADTGISDAMLAFVNRWPDKPVRIRFNTFTRAIPDMMLQNLSGTVVERAYVNGAFTGRWPFSLYIRKNGASDQDRLDAVQVLTDIGRWMAAQPLPDIGPRRTPIQLEMTALPSKSAAHEDGMEEYQAIFALTYKESP